MLHDPKKQAQIEEELFEASLQPWQRVLLDTAAFFKENGWCTGHYEFYDHSYPVPRAHYCLVGGMARVTGQQHDKFSAREVEGGREFYAFIEDKIVERGGDTIEGWNDYYGYSKEHVIYNLQLCALGG